MDRIVAFLTILCEKNTSATGSPMVFARYISAASVTITSGRAESTRGNPARGMVPTEQTRPPVFFSQACDAAEPDSGDVFSCNLQPRGFTPEQDDRIPPAGDTVCAAGTGKHDYATLFHRRIFPASPHSTITPERTDLFGIAGLIYNPFAHAPQWLQGILRHGRSR